MDDGIDRTELTPEELAAGRCYGMSIDWSSQDEVFLASFPDVPGVVTHGATREEAAAMGDEVIAVWLTVMRELGQSVPPPTAVDPTTIIERPGSLASQRIREIRHGLGVSQRVFADLLNVSVATVRAWEQGARTPDGAATRLLQVIERHPDAIIAVSSPADSAAA